MVTTITSTIAPSDQTMFDVTFNLCQKCLVSWVYSYHEWFVSEPRVTGIDEHMNTCDECGGTNGN